MIKTQDKIKQLPQETSSEFCFVKTTGQITQMIHFQRY